MTHVVIFSPVAQQQLDALYLEIISSKTPAVAEKFTSSIVDYCERLARFPRRGKLRDDLRPGLRTVGFRRRVTIAFSVEEEYVVILGIFYGGQDFEAPFKFAM